MIPLFVGFVIGAACMLCALVGWGVYCLPRAWPPAVSPEEIAAMRQERAQREDARRAAQ